jgi:hypothetical protein
MYCRMKFTAVVETSTSADTNAAYTVLLQWTALTRPRLRVAMTTDGTVLAFRHLARVQNHDSKSQRVPGDSQL